MHLSATAVEKFFQLSLLGLVASGFLAIAGSGYLDTPTSILTAGGLLLRAALVAGLVRFEISERTVTVLTIAYIGFYPLDYQFLSHDFLAATIHLLFFLAVVRVLTAKTNRDYIYTAVIALLELLAAALLSIQLNFFLFLGFFVLFSIATLTSAEIRRAAESVTQRSGQISRRSTKRVGPRLAGLTLLVTFGVLALTSGLFFLLPRTANAALRHLVAKGYFLPGFSNQVTLGQIGEIKKRSTAVMHVRVEGGRLNAKWRGAALSDFDGKRWFNPIDRGEPVRVTRDGWTILADDTQRRRLGKRVDYRVDVKGIDTTTLFFAGIPEALNLNAPSLIRSPQGNYRVGVGTVDGVRYAVQSFLEDRAASPPATGTLEIPAAIQARYLQLPPLDSRIPALAREMSTGKASLADRAVAIEERLKRDYGYTLELPKTAVSDPLAYFLFSRKKGHCEYFASAMAVMLRSIGIPTRMVTGFQSGMLNPITEMYVIRASDAHSWVEAYLPERGWTTFDPTPPDPNAQSVSWWTTLGFYADAADTFWQEWVVSYDLGRQLALADKMEQSSSRFRIDWLNWTGASMSRWQSRTSELVRRSFPAALIVLAVILGGILLGPGAWRSLRLYHRARRARRGQASVADATLLYTRFLEILSARGYSKPPWFTPTELARSVRNTEVGGVSEQFVAAYQDLRFGGKTDAAPRLFVLLEELRRRA